jgi:hypothetical protein
MAQRAKDRISQETLCEIAGTSVSVRREWAKKKRLRERGRAGYEEEDAVELAALRALIEGLGPTDGAIAWSQLRPELANRANDPDLVAVYDAQEKSASLEASLGGLRSRLTFGHHIAIVDMADPIERIRQAFRRVADA